MLKSVESIFEHNWNDFNNCGSSTLNTILEYFEDREKNAFISTLQMFDDVGKQDTVCGAVLGVNIAMGKILQNYDKTDVEIKHKIKMFKKDFISKFGSTMCFDILKDYKEGETIDINSENCKNKCHELVKSSILNAMEILNEDTNPLIPVMNRYKFVW